ncbi:zinc finger protein 569-like [Saccostrea cucullata]|uniref:zinc finger protein 569-like n=1 Tax=Saccostrea cuccullata TaxID=36930 RepID=UPI002ED64EB5
MSSHNSDPNPEDSDIEEESSGLFVCGVCSTSFPNKRKLTFHMKKKHNQSCEIPDCELTCYVCCKKFSQPYNLQRHISRVHKKDKPFSCDRCGKTFSDKRTMLHHREYQHSEYRCALCGLSFDENMKLETHPCCGIFIEGSEKPYGCKTCKKWFGNGSTLHLHVRTHSFIEEDSKLVTHYTCGVCTEVFKTRKEFNDHMKTHKKDQDEERKTTHDIVYHELEKIIVKKIDSKNGKVLVECDVCGKNLSMNSIHKHKKIHNGELKMLSCSVCEKEFTSSHNLQRHMNTVHMNKKSYCCEHCGKLFAEKATMLYHKYTQHAKNACKTCGLSFDSKSQLHKHECYAVLYDNGSKKPLYGCTKCKKYFVHKCKLHRHMKNHIDSGPKLLSARSKRLLAKFKNQETDGNNETEDKTYDEEGRRDFSSDSNEDDNNACNSREDRQDDMKIHQKNLNTESEMHPDLPLFQEPNKIAVKKIDPENGLVLVECDICGKTLSINSIQNHKKRHSVHMQNDFKCSFCEKVMSNLHNLRRHISAVHMNEKTFCCEYCGRLFKEKSSMTYHVNSQHSEVFCKSCGLSFENEFNLQEHECLAVMNETGEKRNRFGCKKCEKGFSQRYKLHRHLWKHVGPKKISAKSKRLIEKLQNEEMEYEDSSSDERGISSDMNEISDSEMDNEERKERSSEARETPSIVSNCTTHTDNSEKRAAGVLFCEICKEMFVCEDDFEHHQMWHEDVSVNTE